MMRHWPTPPDPGILAEWLAADWRLLSAETLVMRVAQHIAAGHRLARIIAIHGQPPHLTRIVDWARNTDVPQILLHRRQLPFGPLALELLIETIPDGPAHRLSTANAQYWLQAPPLGPRGVCGLNRPALTTAGALAEWLGIKPAQLDWHADLAGFEAGANARLRHYHYRWIAKANGGRRLLEIPKPRHAMLQRRVLDAMLRDVPPHRSAYGIGPGRSVREHAAQHCGQAVVVRLDLTDFFAHVGAARITAIFQALGYPRTVARLLSGLTTNTVPAHVSRADRAGDARARRRAWWRRKQLAQPHLPQGACTSPMLAHLAAFGLDRRLVALAQAYDATYTRYADDLAFSGNVALGQRLGAFIYRVGKVVHDEGFALNRRKIRVMRAGGRQRLTGVVVNQRPNLSRADFDRLKAILHNCVRQGPASQSRGHAAFRDHLRGRIAWAAHLNPKRGARLLALFEQIDWGDPAVGA